MYYILTIVFSIIILIINNFLYKKKINLLNIFCGLWMIITFLAHLELFGMNHISELVYKIVFFGVFGFGSGYIISTYFRQLKKNKELDKRKIEKENIINENLLKILISLTFLFYGVVSIRVFNMLLHGTSYAVIRSMYQGYYGYSSIFPNGLMKRIDTYIAHPFLYVLIPITLISFFEKRMSKKWIILSIADLILYLVCSASRFLLLYFIIELAYCVYHYYKNMLKKNRRKIFRILLLLCVVIFTMTYVRSRTVSNGKYTIIQNLYAYFTVEFPLMEHWISLIPTNTYGNGVSFFHGTIGLFSKILKFIGFPMTKYDIITSLVVQTEETFVKVFPWKSYNAFISMFYFFYLDFRFIGVYIGSMIFGFFCSNVDANMVIKDSYKSKVLFLLILQNVFTSFVRWQFFNLNMVVSLVFIIVLFLPVKIKKR